MDDHRVGAVRNAGDKIEGDLDQRGRQSQSALGNAKDAFGGATIADRASAFVKQTAAGETAASAVQDAAQKAGAQASDMGERLYDRGRRAGESVVRTVEQQPLAAVLIAAALGYGIAYLVHHR